MNKFPISLIIDDGGPVNMFYFHQLSVNHELLVPAAFARRFADVCRRQGIRGKFSVVPNPGGLGRIDQQLAHVPMDEVKATLDVLRQEVAPMFSITPEIVTHYLAYDPKSCYCKQICEDEYIAKLNAEQIADYVEIGLEILDNAGFTPKGVTSPWMTGDHNELDYAKGIGLAFHRRYNTDHCFYFLHGYPELKRPVIKVDSPETGKVVAIPRTLFDAFWNSQLPATENEAAARVQENIDSILSPDGKSGMIRDRQNEGLPLILIAHWQSLFSDGRAIGLDGLDMLCSRINRFMKDEIEWQDFDTIARNTAFYAEQP